MKVLIDSNVILEVILQREEFEAANGVLMTLYEGKHEMYLTTGCFYGLLYTVDKYFRKEMKMMNPERNETLRSVMSKVLSLMKVAGHDNESLLRGMNDEQFTDLEDSCQYQAAIKAGCDCLISFNVKDYANSTTIKAMTPKEFLESIHDPTPEP